MKKVILFLVIGILVISGFSANALNDEINNDFIKSLEVSITVSTPTITDNGQYVTVNLDEATSTIQEVGRPMLPVVTKIFTFPFGTKINSVDVSFSEENTFVLSKEVQPVLKPVPMSFKLQSESEQIKDITIYDGAGLYPTNSFSIVTGSGLANGKHVLILGVKCYFARYSPAQNTIYYSKNADIKVIYEEPKNPVIFDDVYDLVIITPSEYSDELEPLVNHKNSYNVRTFLKTTQEIYDEYDAFDEAEEIKFFIKDSIENWDISEVLLIGSIDVLPIRSTDLSVFHEDDVLSDLYYQDIYDDGGYFCDWDGNNNGIFGEVEYDEHNMYDIDDLDLFPDVNLGRLACMNEGEVSLIVDKIIYYETDTYGKSWFNNIILCGGDTFPFWNGNEGEEINNIVEGIMTDFIPKKLWTSDNTFSAWNLNSAINNGAGFVDYSGHGYTNSMGTHPPNRNRWIYYFNINLLGLSNGYKLPIVYFDACLTSKLDYDTDDTNVNSKAVTKFLDSFIFNQILSPILRLLRQLLYPSKPQDSPELVSCFAWNWIIKNNGGAIATIGATRTAYGGVNRGAGKMSIEFFKGYDTSDNLGEMMTYSQNEYIVDVPYDLFTVEEFVLLGDPSLKVGGYS